MGLPRATYVPENIVKNEDEKKKQKKTWIIKDAF